MNGKKKKNNKGIYNDSKNHGAKSERPKKSGSEVARNIGGTVKDVVTAAKVGYDLIKLINDPKWYTSPLPISIAANPTRLMDQQNITTIEKRAFCGSVTRYIDVGCALPDVLDNEAIDQAVARIYQAIRVSLKSNLPYSMNFVKAYLLNAISMYAVIVNISKNIQWSTQSMPDLPDWQEMWRNRVPTDASYGAMDTREISWLRPDRLSVSIAQYNKLVSATKNTAVFPATWAKFIDYYLGNVFANDTDGQSTQIENLTMTNAFSYAYNPESDTVERAYVYDFAEVDPDYALREYMRFVKEYSIVIADIVKAKPSAFTNLHIEYYGMEDVKLVYSSTFHNVLVNGYTSNEGVNEEGFVRLDDFLDSDCDNYAKFMFMGGLGGGNNRGFTIKNMTYKAKFPAGTILPAGIYQGNSEPITLTSSKIIGVVLTSDISTDIYFNSNIIEAAVDQRFTAGSTGSTTVDSVASNVTKIGAESATSASQFTAAGPFRAWSTSEMDIQTPSFGVGDTVYAFIPWVKVSQNNTTQLWLVYYYTSQPIVSGQNEWNIGGTDVGQWGLLNINSSTAFETVDGVWLTKSQPTSNMIDVVTDIHVASSATINIWSSDTSGRPSDNIAGGVFGITKGNLSYTLKQLSGPTTSMHITYDNLRGFTGGSGESLTGYTWSGRSNAISPTAGFYVATSSEQIVSSSVTHGFDALNSIGADQFDYHIPMYHRVTDHKSRDGGATWSKTTTGTDLIKESYVSYFYNIKELPALCYNVWFNFMYS